MKFWGLDKTAENRVRYSRQGRSVSPKLMQFSEKIAYQWFRVRSTARSLGWESGMWDVECGT